MQDKAFPYDAGYNYAYLDEQTKRRIRRAILSAVCIPGYQVPFSSTELPLPPSWGTGGIQVTASLIGKEDILKVIDQGTDDSTNAINIRRFFANVAQARTTTDTRQATIIQTRHRIPERSLAEDQILVLQVPNPEPLRRLIGSGEIARQLHAYAEYSLVYLILYEDIAKFAQYSTSYDYPVLVNNRYVASPSPIPKFDNPKLHQNTALMIFGAGREQRIYAIPPYTDVVSLDLEDYPFEPQRWDEPCYLCGSHDTYLDEVASGDGIGRQYVCSDTAFCAERRAESKQ